MLAELSEDDSYVTYIERIEGTQAVRFVANVGDRRVLYASASGRVFLAFLSSEFRKSYFARTKLIQVTNKRAVTRAELLTILERVRRTRVAATDDDAVEGVIGFSSPIFGANGEIVAALSIAAPASRGHQNAEMLSQQVLHRASRISRILGYVTGREAFPELLEIDDDQLISDTDADKDDPLIRPGARRFAV